MIIIENPLRIKYKFVLFEVNKKTIEEFQNMEKARIIRNEKVRELKSMIINGNHFDSPIIINDKGKKRIIDGQHRICAIRQIITENPEFIIQVALVVYQNLDRNQEKEMFTRWNSGTRQTGEDILQIYTDEIPIYGMLYETGKICIYHEPGKIKFRNIIQPYIMAQEGNSRMYLNPYGVIEKSKRLKKDDAEKIEKYLKELIEHTKGNRTFTKATGQYALTYVYFTNNQNGFWKKFNKVKKYKAIIDAGEQEGRFAVYNLINVMKNKMFGIPIPLSQSRVGELFTEEKIEWLRKNYPKTTWDREDLTQEFNEKFKTNLSETQIGSQLTKNKIKKDEKYRGKIASTYTKNVMDHMRELSNTMIVTEARKACELKFEHQFSPARFGQEAKKKGIVFCHSREEINLNANPKQREIIRKYKNKPADEIRDKIIEEIGIDVPIGTIRSELRRIGGKDTSREINKSLKDMGADDGEEDLDILPPED